MVCKCELVSPRVWVSAFASDVTSLEQAALSNRPTVSPVAGEECLVSDNFVVTDGSRIDDEMGSFLYCSEGALYNRPH